MASGNFQVEEMQKHLKNIEQEINALKKLIQARLGGGGWGEEIEAIRAELIKEGFDEELIRLVGTASLREEDYKKEIRGVISGRL